MPNVKQLGSGSSIPVVAEGKGEALEKIRTDLLKGD
jgi:hypothetical protein